ncbi:hypothetical protein CRENBAI_012227 [Crenichthys baileyi]|uniref:Uncharacterized protein n=1 Tax=Crenichthys baileyi TaxID=28760 RepID=A0AAV9SL59_9TELE
MSGLIHAGDELKVNMIPVDDKKPEEIIPTLGCLVSFNVRPKESHLFQLHSGLKMKIFLVFGGKSFLNLLPDLRPPITLLTTRQWPFSALSLFWPLDHMY